MLLRPGDDLVHRFFRIGARAPWHAYLSKTSAESFLKSRVFQRWFPEMVGSRDGCSRDGSRDGRVRLLDEGDKAHLRFVDRISIAMFSCASLP